MPIHAIRHTETAADTAAETADVLTGTLAGANRLDRALADVLAHTGPDAKSETGAETGPTLSRARLQALITQGLVRIDGRIITSPSAKVAAGAGFVIHLPCIAPSIAAPQNIALTILHEDEHLIIIDKPAGLVVHPAAGNLDGTLVNALLHHCHGQLSGIGGVARPGIVHRIDKGTSGLLVAAKTDRAHDGLAQQFANHTIERAYLAIVGGWPEPAAGTLRGSIARSEQDRKKMALLDGRQPPGRGKHVVTHYQVLERLGASRQRAAALVECRLETGRTHQVRVHMASIHHALLGDPAYGHPPGALRPLLSSLGFVRQALHAAVLGFVHPVSGERLRFLSDPPADMRALLKHLRAATR